MSVMPSAGRFLLLASGVAVLFGPLIIAMQLARYVPVDWLAWVPLALALLLSWSVLAPR